MWGYVKHDRFLNGDIMQSKLSSPLLESVMLRFLTCALIIKF